MPSAKPKLSRKLQNVPQLQKQLKTKPEHYWIGCGETMALKLFHEMAEHVPAYKAFLHEHGINHRSIKTISDFKTVPTINKDNYLRKYQREDLCWDGKFASESWVVSTTSGSTGEPFYFPRTDLQDELYAVTAELYLRENFNIQDRKTLFIDAFAMGAWIGGLFTYEAYHRIAQKGYPLTIITPGLNKGEVISSVKRLAANFDQVIIGCYPPVMRDIIDLGISEGINWSDHNLGIIFSAEGFSETFRDYVAERGKLSNIYTSSLNHYGTVDLGTMSHETAPAIAIRRAAVDNKKLFKGIFGDVKKLPTLTQYLPEMFYFESEDDGVICSSYSGLPLVRYDLMDHGGVKTLAQIAQAYEQQGLNLPDELARLKLTDKLWNLPFVYVYERSDFSVNLVGGVIYPEEIRAALLTAPIAESLTGKFTMAVNYDKKLNPKLEVHVEMQRGKDSSNPALKKQVEAAIVVSLLKDNSEYGSNYATYGRKLHPKITLWPYEHPRYFSGRGKQKWVEK